MEGIVSEKQQQPLPGQEGFVPDPKAFRHASAPHESKADADAAMQAFIDDVAEARKKHRIRDVLIVQQIAYYEGDGENRAASINSFGESTQPVLLAAYAYGHLKSEHEEMFDALTSPKVSRRRSAAK
jgi:hypothetical protein